MGANESGHPGFQLRRTHSYEYAGCRVVRFPTLPHQLHISQYPMLPFVMFLPCIKRALGDLLSASALW